jgi:quercetin dioxygenase-like cupin family protein
VTGIAPGIRHRRASEAVAGRSDPPAEEGGKLVGWPCSGGGPSHGPEQRLAVWAAVRVGDRAPGPAEQPGRQPGIHLGGTPRWWAAVVGGEDVAADADYAAGDFDLILAAVFGVMPYGAVIDPRLALQRGRRARPSQGSPDGAPGDAGEGQSAMEYERGRKDGVPSNVGPKPTFTGHAMQDALLDDGEKGEIRVYSVIFEPGARTYWHSHASGQTLLINSGEGMVENKDGDKRVVRAGDVVWAPPGEVHWHGAAPEAFLSHTAVSLGLTSWEEEVDQDHYLDAFEGE